MTKEQESPVILVTGGAGYVGSHSVLLLLEQNHRVVVVDNCSCTPMSNVLDSNGNVQELPESLRRVEQLACKRLTCFQRLDLVTDSAALSTLFKQYHIQAVIHFAALKSVSESIGQPLEYYTNNLIGTINLLNVMKANNCKKMIFSSSATVYGLPQYLPVDEQHQVGLNILNPYGRTKYMVEQILRDLCSTAAHEKAQDSDGCNGNNSSTGQWTIIALRYFNPVGAHPSGYIGEHTQGVPNNLMPYVSQVSIKKRERLYVFGDDFETRDGTGVRDYIHIMDLASGHTHALDYLLSQESARGSENYKVFNLGTGRGYSVLEVIKLFEQINGVQVPYEVTSRREGDAGEVYADASLANRELNWSAKHSLVDMCRDTYTWQSTYPNGFESCEKNLDHETSRN